MIFEIGDKLFSILSSLVKILVGYLIADFLIKTDFIESIKERVRGNPEKYVS